MERSSNFENEKSSIIQEYQCEVKSWKKQLCSINKKHIKLQKKLAVLDNDYIHDSPEVTVDHKEFTSQNLNTLTELTSICSICTEKIPNYTTEYYCGQIVSPVCSDCKQDANLSENTLH